MKNYTRNQIISIVLGGIILLGLGFAGGEQYSKSVIASGPTSGTGARGTFAGRMMGGRMGGGGAIGQIVKNDGTNITISLPNGNSELIMLNASTTIAKSTPGAPTDLTAGSRVAVIGSTNADGSISAQSIQLR